MSGSLYAVSFDGPLSLCLFNLAALYFFLFLGAVGYRGPLWGRLVIGGSGIDWFSRSIVSKGLLDSTSSTFRRPGMTL